MQLPVDNQKTYTLIPRLPVLGWGTLSGKHRAPMHCLLDHPRVAFTTSGRASILLAMEMLGVGAGDSVLVPTYHCPTMVAPIIALGATPIFYPINASGGPELSWLKRQNLQNVRAILAAHYFGLPQPMRALREWCDTQGIALIEDCAHALFGTSEGRAIGSWGDLAIASLTKFLPVPEGGCLGINANCKDLPRPSAPGALCQVKAVLDMIQVGTMFRRFKGLNTALGSAFTLVNAPRKQLQRIRTRSAVEFDESANIEGFSIDLALSHRALTTVCKWLAKYSPRERIVLGRRRNFQVLAEALSGHAAIRPLLTELPENCAPYVFPLWVSNPDPGYMALRQLGVPLSRWDRPWPNVPDIPDDHGVLWSHHVLQLPCHQDLTEGDLKILITEILRSYAHQPNSAGAQ